LLIAFKSYSQIDQKKLDSLSRSIDSSAKAYRAWQDSFNKVQDSIYQAAINKDFQSSHNPGQLSPEQKRKEAKERQKIILRIGVSIAILIIAAIVWLRRKKTKT
jgi:hypothetical protein